MGSEWLKGEHLIVELIKGGLQLDRGIAKKLEDWETLENRKLIRERIRGLIPQQQNKGYNCPCWEVYMPKGTYKHSTVPMGLGLMLRASRVVVVGRS